MNQRAFILSAALVITGNALAAPVGIINPGFEALYFGSNLPAEYNGDVPPTAFPVGPAPTGWNAWGAVGGAASIGVLNPGTLSDNGGTFFPAGAAEGDNVALSFFASYAGGAEFGFEQTLAATLQANTRYTLSVKIGNIASGSSSVAPFASYGYFDLRGFPGYRVELLAGGVVIAEDTDTVLPVDGEFLSSVVVANIDAVHPQLGQALGIRLVNMNQQDLNDPAVSLEVDFDDVQLDATDLAGIASGDINADGLVDSIDVLLASRIALGILNPATEQLLRGDVAPLTAGVSAPDAVINAGDVFVILQRALSP